MVEVVELVDVGWKTVVDAASVGMPWVPEKRLLGRLSYLVSWLVGWLVGWEIGVNAVRMGLLFCAWGSDSLGQSS